MESHQIESKSEEQQPLPITYEHKDRESIRSRLAKVVMRMLRIKRTFDKRTPSGELSVTHTEAYSVPEPPKQFFKEFDIISWQIKGRNVYRLTPKQNGTKKHILFLHGGAYVMNSTKYHWELVKKIIKDIGCTVTYPDYPLAPAHSYKDTFEMIEPVYNQLVEEVDKNDLILMGDSAGGGLSLALVQKMKHQNVRQPAQIILIYPWLDITLTHPDIPEADKNDLMLGIEGLRMAGKLYAKDTDPSFYLVSPINGEVEGLGQISVFVGTYDILFPDCKKFKEICDKKGVKINYFEYPKMLHGWLLFGIPESQKAIEQIGLLLNR